MIDLDKALENKERENRWIDILSKTSIPPEDVSDYWIDLCREEDIDPNDIHWKWIWNDLYDGLQTISFTEKSRRMYEYEETIEDRIPYQLLDLYYSFRYSVLLP